MGWLRDRGGRHTGAALEKLSTFLGKSGLPRQDREVLWSLLAHAMRSADRSKPLVRVVKGKTTVRELMHPFAHFLAAVGSAPTAMDVLEQSLRGRETRFPFGVIQVDERGHVLQLTADTAERSVEPAKAAGRIHTA